MRKININVYSKNLNRLKASLYQKLGNITQADEQVLLEEAETILQESLSEVPKATGTLASIAGISNTRLKPTRISIQVGYGVNGDKFNEKTKMFATKYMLTVHEDLSRKHPNGKAKFLEDPVNRAKERILARLKAAGRRHWK